MPFLRIYTYTLNKKQTHAPLVPHQAEDTHQTQVLHLCTYYISHVYTLSIYTIYATPHTCRSLHIIVPHPISQCRHFHLLLCLGTFHTFSMASPNNAGQLFFFSLSFSFLGLLSFCSMWGTFYSCHKFFKIFVCLILPLKNKMFHRHIHTQTLVQKTHSSHPLPDKGQKRNNRNKQCFSGEALQKVQGIRKEIYLEHKIYMNKRKV